MSCKKVSPTVTYASEQQSHTWELEGNSLLDGTYDEEESAASFQQALAEWRAQAGKTSTSNETQASPMRGMANVFVCDIMSISFDVVVYMTCQLLQHF